MTHKRIIVIGAGASGMMAAGLAAELGAEVLLLEKMERPGKKLLISGQTRCNLTNARELDDFIAMYGPNGRFLYSIFHRYFRDDLLAFLQRYGVETMAEPDGRIFPASSRAGDVVNAFQRYMDEHGVQIHTRTGATGIQVHEGQVTGIETDKGVYPAAAVILATGGASYPGTGSSGDGYHMAEAIGHTIVKLRPGLVPLVVHEIQLARSMQSVSLSGVRLTSYRCPAGQIDPSLTPTHDFGCGTGYEQPPQPIIESRFGDMMMTHFGIGGPITLQMSLAIVDALQSGPVSVSIDLNPGISEKERHRQLQEHFDRFGKRSYRRLLTGLLTRKMIGPFIEMTGIPPDKPGNKINAEERARLAGLLKSLCFNIERPLPISDATVTAGGISLREIDPKTMASLLVGGLYFCGEVIDIDADTGGYNLQAAFSTGYVAGGQAAGFVTAIP